MQIGNLYGLLGQLYLQRAASLPAALQARCKKQASALEISYALHSDANTRLTELCLMTMLF